jgi:hypothetical protein
MQRRFGIWFLTAFALFVGASIFGWLLTAAIGPRNPDYGRFVPLPARVAVVTAVQRNFTAFQPARKPTFPESVEFQNVLNDLASRTLNRDNRSLGDIFDTPRMAEEEIPLGLYAFFGQQPIRPIVESAGADILQDLATLMTNAPDTFPPGRVEIRQVMWSNDRVEALVVAKHVDPLAGTRFTRWWMVRRPLGWRVYDFDFPNTRLRFLTVRNYLMTAPVRDHVGAGPNRDADPNAPDVDAYARYRNAFEWLQLAGGANDPAAANASVWIEPIDAVPMLPYIQAGRHVLRARQMALRGDAAKTAAAVSAIPTALANAAHVRFAQAVLANARKKPTEAREAIRVYRTHVGDDPIAYLEDAKAAAALDGAPAAIAELRAGLTVFPGDTSLAMELARRLPAEERVPFGEELARTAKPDILGTAATLFEKQFPSILDALCTGFLRAKPNDPMAIAIGIQAKLALGQTRSAADLLIRIPAAQRTPIVDRILQQATYNQMPTEIFQMLSTAGEGRRAFRALTPVFANNLLLAPAPPAEQTRRLGTLRAMVATHRAADPNDPWLHYGEAVVFAAAGEQDKADTELKAGLAKLPEPVRTERLPIRPILDFRPDDRNEMRHLRADLLFKRGKWKQAYDELLPAVDTFDQLAAEFAFARDEFALAELIERHAKAHADDIETIVWRAELAYLKGQNESAVKLFREYRDKSGKENRHIHRMHERMIRSLVRLERPDEAAEALDEAGNIFQQGRLFPVLVAAAKGDVDFVMEQFDGASPFNPSIWYSDPDLGPLLRKPAFERLRQKYPPPVR